MPERALDRFYLYSVKIQYRFSGFDLDATTSQWNRESDTLQDSSESFQWAFALPSFYTSQGGIGASTSLEEDLSKQFSHEVRLTSSTNSEFQWLVGYFYADLQSALGALLLAPGAVPVFGTANLFTNYEPPFKSIQQAEFGELSYQLTPKLKVTAGLRHYSYSSTVYTAFSGVAGSGSIFHLCLDYPDQLMRAPAATRDHERSPETLRVGD